MDKCEDDVQESAEQLETLLEEGLPASNFWGLFIQCAECNHVVPRHLYPYRHRCSKRIRGAELEGTSGESNASDESAEAGVRDGGEAELGSDGGEDSDSGNSGIPETVSEMLARFSRDADDEDREDSENEDVEGGEYEDLEDEEDLPDLLDLLFPLPVEESQ